MESSQLRVVTYNIHKGFGTGNSKFTLESIRERLRWLHPDLVFLQEVLGHHSIHRKTIKNWPEEPQFEYLAQELWPHFAYGKNAVYTTGHHGNAILSKYPILFFENIDISTNHLEKRGLLHAVIELPHQKKPLHAVCLHLGLLESERVEQIHRLFQRVQSHVPADDFLVIGGDFNDWRGKLSARLERNLNVTEAFESIHGFHAKTFPSWLPILRLDRIYTRGLTVKAAQCLANGSFGVLSDHAALLADLAT